MDVIVSEMLASKLHPKALEVLVQEFHWWKSDFENREYESLFLGKDSAMIEPTVNGEPYSLMHCHLIPLNDAAKKRIWARDHRFRKRKTSDRVLFYVQSKDKFFLIDIADDPGAHELMRMGSPEARDVMYKIRLEGEKLLSTRQQSVLTPK